MNKAFEEMVATATAKAGHAVIQTIVECANWYNLDDAEMRTLTDRVWQKLRNEDA